MKPYFIQVSEEMGRGVYAKSDLEPGQVITTCELLVLSSKDSLIVNNTDLCNYVFKFDDERDCLCLGEGSLFNHSDSPNVSYSLTDYGDRKLMSFITIKAVKQGEQLFTNYAQDTQISIDNYLNNKSLVG